MHTPLLITPYSPAGTLITLPMPDSVDERDYDVSFTFRDATDGAGNPVDVEALVRPVLCDGSVQTPIVTRNGVLKRIARDPAPMVRAEWKQIEPFGATERNYTAYGGLYLAAKPFDRKSNNITLVLYKAQMLIGFPSKTLRVGGS